MLKTLAMTYSKSAQRILDAFRDLVLCTPYDQLTIGNIIDRAGVARSTFYVHFPDKRTLLMHSLEPLLDTFVRCVAHEAQRAEVVEFVEHCWDNRVYGRAILASPAQRAAVSGLAQMLQLRADVPPIDSTALAHGLLGVLARWMGGELAADQEDVVNWLLNQAWEGGKPCNQN